MYFLIYPRGQQLFCETAPWVPVVEVQMALALPSVPSGSSEP
jgi:hypothetical protein